MTKINSIKTSNGSVHKIDEGIGFPSKKYIDLEFKDQAVYEAPANGYVICAQEAGRTDGWLRIFTVETDLSSISFPANTTNWAYVWMPVGKGDSFGVRTTLKGEVQHFRFIYAQGSEPDE